MGRAEIVVQKRVLCSLAGIFLDQGQDLFVCGVVHREEIIILYVLKDRKNAFPEDIVYQFIFLWH